MHDAVMLTVWAGEVDYRVALGWQEQLVEARREGLIDDVLLMLSHPPVYTAGRHADVDANVTGLRPGIPVVRIDRGGDVTYHGPGQAHGLCFSVRPGVRVPPSLVNIYKELHSDIGFAIPRHGCLQAWAEHGVLLLNAVLTVERGNAGAHQGKGWERFTDRIVEVVNAGPNPVVFLLWGSHAKKKGQGIDRSRHLVLTAPHPSPLSAHRGFLGCRHFSRANQWLEEQG
ncbi:MAG: uracil-DNA glycosylase [Actinomycetota bacterium]